MWFQNFAWIFNFRRRENPKRRPSQHFIGHETDYDVQVEPVGGGLLRKKQWAVRGTTQSTQVSQSILDQWVRWMVAVGFQVDCEFDGWGALIPSI